MHQLALQFTAPPRGTTPHIKPPTVSDKILHEIRKGAALTYSELQARIGGTETAISARLRELQRAGLVAKRLRSQNLWEWFCV